MLADKPEIATESAVEVIVVPVPGVKPNGPYSILKAVPFEDQFTCADVAVRLLANKKIGAGHGGGNVIFTIQAQCQCVRTMAGAGIEFTTNLVFFGISLSVGHGRPALLRHIFGLPGHRVGDSHVVV